LVTSSRQHLETADSTMRREICQRLFHSAAAAPVGQVQAGRKSVGIGVLAPVLIALLAGLSGTWLHAAPTGPVQPDLAAAAAGDRDSALARQPTWSQPSYADLRRRCLEWIAASAASEDARVEAVAVWPESAAMTDASVDHLDAVMRTIALVDPRAAALERDPAADHAWLDGPDLAVFERETIRLWLGRECVRRDRFDDGLALLADLDLSSVVDPASLLFHRAACQHWLLESDAAIESLDRLLERAGEIPVRYERLARLMRTDLAALEDESLDHIARRMKDITRRLDQGRAGPRTRTVQDGVISSLDKLIAAIEEQQQKNQCNSGASGGSGRGGGGKPMDDSRLADGKGPGEVTRRDLGDGDGWGNLPPHERDEALQQIGREFPAHYREAIEQYFKRLASGGETR
jgi:hypothetical protein